ncbi:hydrophobic surface binding protein [Collybia nuda]|uniref:Hydrophobic surface binding protein n=1 Tax=Collybia nuda TaxID=64659 RepID=A0A9P5Y025_9AGAR|nr:hydrophobic surface binding protein [Collybia nuda]
MVHISSTLLLAFAFVATAISTPLKRTVAEIQADIADISAQVTSLDQKITAFPATGGSLAAALIDPFGKRTSQAIHSSSGTLVASLKKGTTDVTATGPVNEADGGAILSSVNAFEPTIQHALVGIVEKRPAFQALPIGGIPALVLQDLKDLNTNTVAFSDALITNAPDSLKGAATQLKDGIVAGFATAIAAYEA